MTLPNRDMVRLHAPFRLRLFPYRSDFVVLRIPKPKPLWRALKRLVRHVWLTWRPIAKAMLRREINAVFATWPNPPKRFL